MNFIVCLINLILNLKLHLIIALCLAKKKMQRANFLIFRLDLIFKAFILYCIKNFVGAHIVYPIF